MSSRASLSSIPALDDDMAPAPRINLIPPSVPAAAPIAVPLATPAPPAPDHVAEATTSDSAPRRQTRGRGSVKPIDVLAEQGSPTDSGKTQVSFRIESDLNEWIADKVYQVRKAKGKRITRDQILNESVRFYRAALEDAV